MTFVLDNSVAMRWCFENAAHPYADGILNRLAAGEDALVPALWFYEASAVLAREQNRGTLAAPKDHGQMQLWKYLPHIKYNAPVAGVEDFASSAYATMDFLFKLTGWCIVIGTLHYGFVKTESVFFAAPEAGLTGGLSMFAYAFFMRFTITLPNGHTVAFHAGRPNPFHWPSFVTMFLVFCGTRVVINHWVDAVVAQQAK